MKVLLVNGSPHEKGCTYTGLSEVAAALNADGIETEIFWLGDEPLKSCQSCAACRQLHQCVFDDVVNQVAAKVDDFDGFVFGSPVHYASACGTITTFMDRLFYSAGPKFAGKVGAAIVSARRGGTTAALDQLNKYFPISKMAQPGSRYWNQVHGNTPEEVKQDLEGMQIMRGLGHEMAWLLKCIEAGKAAGVTRPEGEKTIRTNFIR